MTDLLRYRRSLFMPCLCGKNECNYDKHNMFTHSKLNNFKWGACNAYVVGRIILNFFLCVPNIKL